MIDKILKESVNPVITVIKEFLSQSGYQLNLFTSLYSSDVDILNIEYVTEIPIQKQLKLESLQGCLSSIFNIFLIHQTGINKLKFQ